MESVDKKLDLLFKTFLKPDGTEYTYEEIAEGIDHAVSSVAIWKLRVGKVKNPAYRTLEAIAEFFDVPIEYFSSSERPSEEYVQELKLARVLQEAGVAQIALRASDLGESAKRDILSMIEYARKAQGLNKTKGKEKAKGNEGPQ
jgi:transcriptional regulator with XRE-family HTH domain